MTLLELLSPVWAFSEKEAKILQEAVMEGNREKISQYIKKLEEKLAQTSEEDFPYYLKFRAYVAEIEAKIAVLKAILSNSPQDWEKAARAYENLKDALDGLAASCDPFEDIAQIMFSSDAEKAAKLSNLCLAQIKGMEREAKKRTFAEEAKRLIDRVGPSLGYDFTSSPVLPEERDDIAVVRRSAANGRDYGFDVIYLVWKVGEELHYQELCNSRSSKDYIHIESVTVQEGWLMVKVGSGGSFSGSPWERIIKISISELGLSE